MRIIRKVIVGTLAAFALVAAGGVAASWAPDRPVSELRARWAQPPSQFVEAAGIEVHLRDEGPREDPTPIVLLHGTSSSLHTWDAWASALSTERRVVRFDLPGFGLTGPSADGVYTLESYVSFMRTMLDMFDDLGHVPQEEDPQRTLAAAKSFLGVN